jgi:hypothetical protein
MINFLVPRKPWQNMYTLEAVQIAVVAASSERSRDALIAIPMRAEFPDFSVGKDR